MPDSTTAVDVAREGIAARRLWRMRRRHDHIDAVLSASGATWVLTYWRNQKPMLAWRYPDAAAARAEAAARRRELERAGWTSHW